TCGRAPSVTLCFGALTRLPPRSPLFPYTTLFRSIGEGEHDGVDERPEREDAHPDQGWPREQPGDVGTIGAHMPQTSSDRWWRGTDRKSTRLNSSHVSISYAVFCLKKKKKKSRELM